MAAATITFTRPRSVGSRWWRSCRVRRRASSWRLPAVVHATDDVVLRTAGVGEEDLAELCRAIGLHDAAHFDARLSHRDEQVADALVLGGVGVGTGQQEAVVGVVSAGGPHLLPVDDPLVTVELGGGLQRREVRSAVRLAEPLTPAHRAVQDARQELALLLLGPPLQDGGTTRVSPKKSARSGALRRANSSRGRLLHRGQPFPPYSVGRWRRSSRLEQLAGQLR